MDKETLSNYGWIVICTLVLAVMLALATPFGEFIRDGVWSTTNGLNDVLNKNMEIAGLSDSNDSVENTTTEPFTFTPTEIEFLDKNFNLKKYHLYTTNITYEDGAVETTMSAAMPIVGTEKNIGLYIYDSEGDSVFALIDNCNIDLDTGNPTYVEGNSVYALYSEKDGHQIKSVTIDFDNSVDCSNREGALFEDRFLTWDELKNEYDVTDTAINSKAFERCGTLIYINIPDTVITIGESAFWNCYCLTEINLPNNIDAINNETFRYCHWLMSLTIPDSVTTIGNYAFEHCDYIENLIIPSSVTTLGYKAFSCCESLTDVIILDGVTTINSSVFSDCESLKNITIPKTVTILSPSNFHGCKSLKNITYQGTMTEWNAIQYVQNISNATSITQIICTDGTITF
jgi:hypothetical protein